jgi:hypothetical protein
MEHAGDSDTVSNRGIQFEGKLGSVAQRQVAAELAANKASGMFKSSNRRLLFGFTPYPADIDTGMTEIRRYLNSGDRCHVQPWILQLTQ